MPPREEAREHDAEAVLLAVKLMAVAGQMTVRPELGLTTGVRATVPAKFWMLDSETDTLAPVLPELKLTGLPAETVKSLTWTTAAAE